MTDFRKWYSEKGGKSLIMSLRYDLKLQEEVFHRTCFMNSDASLSERIYVLINDISEQPTCHYCGKPKRFRRLDIGYYGTCGAVGCVLKHRCVINKESSKKINWNESLRKQAETMNERYGARHNWCKESTVVRKTNKTNKKLYGVEYVLQDKKFIDRQQKTAVERHGTTNFLHCEKSRQTIIEKYGIDVLNENIMSSSEAQESWRRTCLDKFGVDNPMKNQDIFNKQQINGLKAKRHDKDQKLIYRGTYEKEFLDKFYDKIDIRNGVTITYEHGGFKKTYHSDYFIESHNLIIEIKSKYYYEKFLDLNLTKQRTCIEQGYDFMFIIDKDYDEFVKKINS